MFKPHMGRGAKKPLNASRSLDHEMSFKEMFSDNGQRPITIAHLEPSAEVS